MIQNGAQPTPKSPKKYSYHRTFGTVVNPLSMVPAEFNFDAGFGMPDQEMEGFPFGCTGYTQTELCQDEDLIKYSPKFTYDKTLMMAGIFPSDPNFEAVGCSVESSLKSTIVYGVLALDNSDPLSHRKGDYFDVLNGSGLDCFDSIRVAMWHAWSTTGKKKSVSTATPWLAEWARLQEGVIPTAFILRGNEPWHNWKICGTKVINGTMYLIGKTWQGKNYGDQGYAYFSRETINKVLALPDILADMLVDYDGNNLKTVKLSLLQTATYYLNLMINKIKATMSTSTTNIQPEPVLSPTEPVLTPLDKFCTAIRDYEGVPGDRNYRNNNPGNCRCSPVGYLPKYGNVVCVNKFAQFPSYQLGWEYLQNTVIHRAELHPDWTVYNFFQNYAPKEDGNDPLAYAVEVAKKCGIGVTIDTKLSELFA